MFRNLLSRKMLDDDEMVATVAVDTAPGNAITPLLDEVVWDGGDTAVVLFSDSRIGEVSLEDGRLQGAGAVSVPASRADDLALSPDGTRLAVATAEGIVLLSRNGDRLIATGFQRLGASFAQYDPTRSILAAESAHLPTFGRTSGHWWDVTGDSPVEIERPLADKIFVWPHPSGLIEAHDRSFQPSLHDPETLEEIASFSLPGSAASFDFRRDAGLFAAGASLGTEVFDATTGEHVIVLDEVGIYAVSTSWSPDGRYLTAAARFGPAVVWDTESWNVVETAYPLDEVISVQFSGDGRWLATVGQDGRVRLLDTDEFALAHELSTRLEPIPFRTFGFIGSDHLLTFGKQGTELWSIEANTRIGDPFPSAPDFTARDAGDSGLITGTDEHLLLWEIEPESWPRIACQAAGRNMTPDEWELLGPHNQQYRSTCPQWPALG